jgi:hypothetical protein
MSVMELKGNFHDLIAQVDDPELLRQMFRQCLDMLKGVDMLDDMPPEAIAELEQAIAESYQDESGVSHEDVKKMFKSWVVGA